MDVVFLVLDITLAGKLSISRALEVGRQRLLHSVLDNVRERGGMVHLSGQRSGGGFRFRVRKVDHDGGCDDAGCKPQEDEGEGACQLHDGKAGSRRERGGFVRKKGMTIAVLSRI